MSLVGNCLHHWFVMVQSTGERLRGSKRVVGVRGLSGVRELLEDLLQVRGGEGSHKRVFMRRRGVRAKNIFNGGRCWG